jgi:outer membrane protein
VTGLVRPLAAALLGLAAVAPAAAAELPLWELGVGVGALHMPHYRGAEQSHDWVLPVPYAVYRGEFVRASREGVRALLVETERVDVDISLSANPPAKSADDRARAGMSDLAPNVELGPSLNATLARGAGWKFDFRAPLRAVLTVQARPRMIGWTAAPKLNLDLSPGGWDLGLQAGPLWGSRRLNAYYYDVGPADATAERPVYQARGGFAGWQATASLSRHIGNRWIGMFLRWDSVDGAVFADSPLVRRPHALVFGIAVSWSLLQSDRLVTGHDDTP